MEPLREVSLKAGVSDKRHYYGFSSTFVDIDDNGKVDLIVTDDSSPNYLYINKGDGTFQDSSFYSGFALNQDARETASMGLAVGDYKNNGLLDLYTTTFSDDYKTLYRNDGEGNFVDITPQIFRRFDPGRNGFRAAIVSSMAAMTRL